MAYPWAPLLFPFLGAKHTPQKIQWPNTPDGKPFDLTGATITARLLNQQTGSNPVASDGTFTLLAGSALTVTAASRAIPITLTIANHGLLSGVSGKVASVGGNLGANGLWYVNVLDPDTVQLLGSVGSGNYTAGGTLIPNVNVFQWAYGLTQDVVAAGNYLVQFKADFGGGSFEYSPALTWQVLPVQ